MNKFNPIKDQIYSFHDLKDHYGKDLSYAFVKNKQLTAFALNPDMNPTAKDYDKHEVLKILVAEGSLRESHLKRVLLKKPYPVFIKKGTNQWQFAGNYYYCGFTKNIKEMADSLVGLVKKLDDIVFLIKLEKAEVALQEKKAS